MPKKDAAPAVLNDRPHLVAVETLEPHPDNPNKGNVEEVRASIRANGFYGFVIAQKSTRRILVGEHRWRAFQEEGGKRIPVVFVDVDDVRARKIMLADNRTGELAERDMAVVLRLLRDMDSTEGTGYSENAMRELIEAFKAPEVGAPGSTEPPAPEEFWPTIEVMVPPALLTRWKAWLATHREPGDPDHVVIARGLDHYDAMVRANEDAGVTA
jgi:hypothetical protein